MNFDQAKDWLVSLQDSICTAIEKADGKSTFLHDNWTSKLGTGSTRLITQGDVFEKGGVNFSHVKGSKLPPAASAAHPEVAGSPFEAAGVSLVLHPENPYIPTTHMNVRIFNAQTDQGDIWWFGGGFDLTPYYGFEQDCIEWHRTAKEACDPFDPKYYHAMKHACDEYFHIKHRQEPRGVGGLFFDDFNEIDFEHSFGFTQSVGEAFIKAYLPIVERRRSLEWGERERNWQCYRRGRYVEFNLVYDRGTLFGLQSGGRTESILMSLPNEVHWHYNHQAEPGSEEARLLSDVLSDREWV